MFDFSHVLFTAVDLWIDYALFLMTDFSSEEAIAPVRKVFERALEDMRYHATEGKQLWDSYRDMEQGYLMYLAGAAESGQLMDAKTLHEQQYQNILSIFKRELRCPLIGKSEATRGISVLYLIFNVSFCSLRV